VVIQYWTDKALARTVVVVEDDGVGVAPGIRDRIFEPYFTTKTQGGSSGLGLFVASQILRDFGATIELVADQSVGAAFRIEFSLAPEGSLGQAGEA
jgi:C4-dicarboxylate-specific signal transduction histidine kinase